MQEIRVFPSSKDMEKPEDNTSKRTKLMIQLCVGLSVVSGLIGIGNFLLWQDGEYRRDAATKQRLRADQLEARTRAVEIRLADQDQKLAGHEQNIIQLGSVAHRHIEKPAEAK